MDHLELTPENVLLLGSLLLTLSVIASKTSARFGVPTLVVFVGIGMLAGSDAIGGIYFDDPAVGQFVGIVALIFILLSGGLDTQLAAVRPAFAPGLTLATLGVLVTAGLFGLAAHLLLSFAPLEALLLGSVVASTDAAAVFGQLKGRRLALAGRVGPTLEIESGTNDPLAYLLTITLVGAVSVGELDLPSALGRVALQLGLGGLAGWGLGRLYVFILNRIHLEVEGLYPVLLVGLGGLAYAATDALGGNGFLAVYLVGLVLGNADLVHKMTLVRFFDGLAWLMQVVLFLTLGLLVFPSQLLDVALPGLALSALLILVVRPLATFTSLAFFRYTLAERLFIAWAGLRGAVPIVFATFPLMAGLESGRTIFNLVFFIALTSVLVQGSTMPHLARRLGLLAPPETPRVAPEDHAARVRRHTCVVALDAGSRAVGESILEQHLPAGLWIAIIEREDGRFVVPDGQTTFERGDRLTLTGQSEDDLDFGRARFGPTSR